MAYHGRREQVGNVFATGSQREYSLHMGKVVYSHGTRAVAVPKLVSKIQTKKNLNSLQGNLTLSSAASSLARIEKEKTEKEWDHVEGERERERRMCLLQYCATRRCVPRRQRVFKYSPDVATNKYDRSTFSYFSLGPETSALTPLMRDESLFLFWTWFLLRFSYFLNLITTLVIEHFGRGHVKRLEESRTKATQTWVIFYHDRDNLIKVVVGNRRILLSIFKKKFYFFIIFIFLTCLSLGVETKPIRARNLMSPIFLRTQKHDSLQQQVTCRATCGALAPSWEKPCKLGKTLVAWLAL